MSDALTVRTLVDMKRALERAVADCVAKFEQSSGVQVCALDARFYRDDEVAGRVRYYLQKVDAVLDLSTFTGAP